MDAQQKYHLARQKVVYWRNSAREWTRVGNTVKAEEAKKLVKEWEEISNEERKNFE